MKQLHYIFLGDIDQLATRNAPGAKKVYRIGPVFYPQHLVVVEGSEDPVIAARQLKLLMELPEPEARSVYASFQYISQSAFFLAMNDDRYRSLRQRLMMHLNAERLIDEADKNFMLLLNKLTTADNSMLNKINIVSRHVIDIFSETMFGFKITNELYKVIFDGKEQGGIGLYLPFWLFKCLPSTYKARQLMDEAIKSFLRQELQRLRQQQAHTHKNLLAEIVFNRLPQLTSLAQLRDEQIESLLNDPEIRLCVTGLLAVSNFTSALMHGLDRLYSLDANDQCFRDRLEREFAGLTAEEKSNYRVLLDKDRLPLLHAFYLETLRDIAPMRLIPRYTREGINAEHLKIPPRTVVIFELYKMLDRYRGGFLPDRFLTNGKLNEKANLHEGHFAPFGLGARRCPAVQVSELLMKYFFVVFAMRVKWMGCVLILETGLVPAEQMRLGNHRSGLFFRGSDGLKPEANNTMGHSPR